MIDPAQLQSQLQENRRTVGFDSYDLTVKQLLEMLSEKIIDISPEYQRHFVWGNERQSQLIESVFLGIPVPSLFMATNADSTWEVIDGLQRLTTLALFCGSDELISSLKNDKLKKLKLSSLSKLEKFNGTIFEELPKAIQIAFQTRPIRITVLNDRSDFEIRYDLFERLNTGGITLHPQEIRNCVFMGPFNDFIKECAISDVFKKSVIPQKSGDNLRELEEAALKFFAYLENRSNFRHDVKHFLNDYMEEKSKKFKNKITLSNIFYRTFLELSKILPNGIVRSGKKITPIVLFEAISVGVAEKLTHTGKFSSDKLIKLLDDDKLKALTTGATNSNKRLNERVNYVIHNI